MSGFKVTFPGNKRVDVAFDKFEIKTDQASENGGDESAPEPFDVFIGSIGACAGIYAKSFCDVTCAVKNQLHPDIKTSTAVVYLSE